MNEKIKVKVNYRLTSNGEIIAVFFGKQTNGTYLAISLYDGMHFDADPIWIREQTRPAKGYNINTFCRILENRGYDPESKFRFVY